MEHFYSSKHCSTFECLILFSLCCTSLTEALERFHKHNMAWYNSKEYIDSQQAKYGDDYWGMFCICGALEDSGDFDEDVVCDGCKTKRHKVCMGLERHHVDYDWEEDKSGWYCEKCRPDQHRATLAANALGGKVWEYREEMADDVMKDYWTVKRITLAPEGWMNYIWYHTTFDAAEDTVVGRVRTGVEILVNVMTRQGRRAFERSLVSVSYEKIKPGKNVQTTLEAVKRVCDKGEEWVPRLAPSVREILRRMFALS